MLESSPHGQVSSVVAHAFALWARSLPGPRLTKPSCDGSSPSPARLVVENQATFGSLSRVLPDDGARRGGGYGAGNHLTASVASATDLPRRSIASRTSGTSTRRALRSP